MKINNLLCLLALAFGHVVLAQNITGNVTDENGSRTILGSYLFK